MSAQGGFALLHQTKDVFGQVELRENSFQIWIEVPFILYKEEGCLWNCAQTAEGKREKKYMAEHNHPWKPVFGDHVCNDKSLSLSLE